MAKASWSSSFPQALILHPSIYNFGSARHLARICSSPNNQHKPLSLITATPTNRWPNHSSHITSHWLFSWTSPSLLMHLSHNFGSLLSPVAFRSSRDQCLTLWHTDSRHQIEAHPLFLWAVASGKPRVGLFKSTVSLLERLFSSLVGVRKQTVFLTLPYLHLTSVRNNG